MEFASIETEDSLVLYSVKGRIDLFNVTDVRSNQLTVTNRKGEVGYLRIVDQTVTLFFQESATAVTNVTTPEFL